MSYQTIADVSEFVIVSIVRAEIDYSEYNSKFLLYVTIKRLRAE
jgi:hypothetical protein